MFVKTRLGYILGVLFMLGFFVITTPAFATNKLLITPEQLKLRPGESLQLKVVTVGSNGTKVNITRSANYASSDSTIARVERGGKVTAISPGVTTIEVKSGSRGSSVQVKVSTPDKKLKHNSSKVAPRPTKLAIRPGSLSLEVGESSNLTAILGYSDYSEDDITKSIVWAATNRRIVNINEGKVTGVSPGVSHIVIGHGDLGASIQVTVKKPVSPVIEKPKAEEPVTSVVVDKIPAKLGVDVTSVSLEPGQTKQLKVDYTNTQGSKTNVTRSSTYVSNDNTIAKVQRGGLITAVSPGTTKININCNSMTTTATVTVEEVKDEEVITEVDFTSDEPRLSEPDDKTKKQIPAVLVQETSRAVEFEWGYKGIHYTWKVNIPEQLVQEGATLHDLLHQFYQSTALQQRYILNSVTNETHDLIMASASSSNGNLNPWISKQNSYINKLAQILKLQAENDGLTHFETAEFVLAFVQSINYETCLYPKLPTQTLLEGGDCDAKSVLYGSLLRQIGYDIAIFSYLAGTVPGKTSGHMAIGVCFTGENVPIRNYPICFISHEDSRFYLAETTKDKQLGMGIGLDANIVIPIQ